jgi:hypothetical protein
MGRRRPARILLNAATVVSLILALAVAVLWVRSEIVISEQLLWNIHAPAERRTSMLALRSGWGRVRWEWSERVFATREYFDMEHPANPEKRTTRLNSFPRDPGLHLFIERYPRTPPTGPF